MSLNCLNLDNPKIAELAKKYGELMTAKILDRFENSIKSGVSVSSFKNQNISPIASEILNIAPNIYLIGSGALNLNRPVADLDFISKNNDVEILSWLDSNNIPYTMSNIDINFEYKGQNISIALVLALLLVLIGVALKPIMLTLFFFKISKNLNTVGALIL